MHHIHVILPFSGHQYMAFFVFLFLFSSVVHSKDHCPTSYCLNNSLPIQYPFKLGSQHTLKCNYTNLRCSNEGIAILDLPYNGEFYIRDIDYTYSHIKLYDPENCLPKRLMGFKNLHMNPLLYVRHLNYTFYSCPSELIALSNFTTIDCLSNSSISTVATHAVPSVVMTKLYRCSEIVTSSIPVLTRDPPDFIGNQTDFILQWSVPNCENCPHISTGLVPYSIFELAYITMLFLTITMPLLICMGCCVHFIGMFQRKSQ